MPMRKVIVQGEPYRAIPLARDCVTPGTMVAGRFSRKAMRVVCLDGDDAVLRNLRHPDLLEAEPIDSMPEFYDQIEPLSFGV